MTATRARRVAGLAGIAGLLLSFVVVVFSPSSSSAASSMMLEYTVVRMDAPPVANLIALALTGGLSTYGSALALVLALLGVGILREKRRRAQG